MIFLELVGATTTCLRGQNLDKQPLFGSKISFKVKLRDNTSVQINEQKPRQGDIFHSY